MLWSRPPPTVQKPVDIKEKGKLMLMGSVGQELHHLERERAILTDPQETRRRRTIQLVRKDAGRTSWGFTLQTYGIRNKRSREVEVMTYVDYVELHGPAWIAGMRKGDVLLSVNGESVEGLNHPNLVAKIQNSEGSLRLVVLFEDCCRKVELYERFIKLKRILSQKMRDLKHLENEEKLLSSGGRLSRAGLFRDSIRSSTSSDWDCYSEIASPGVLDNVAPNQKVWRQHFFAKSSDTLDTASELSFEYPSPFGSSRESLGVASQDSITQREMSCDGTSEKNLECANTSGQTNGANSINMADNNTSESKKTKFYVEGDEDISDSEVPTLRQSKKPSQSEPYPGCRKRSNSTLLNDMRMKLIADIVNTEASEASKETGIDMCGIEHGSETDGMLDCEITVVLDEQNVPCRLYKGVRINDSDEVTRL